MTSAQHGDTVQVHYTGRLADDTIFDTSRDREPLEFTIGAGQLIAGFEQAVIGLQPGESRTASIPADEAYGEHDPDMVLEVARDQLPDGMDPSVGEQYQLRQQDGDTIVVTVTEATPDSVTLDANHPLAGQDLTFEIELVEIV